MKVSKVILIIGGLLGLISIGLGAYAEHGLKGSLTEQQFHSLSTAIRYHQLYAIVITGIGFGLFIKNLLLRSWLLQLSGVVFILGVLLFSFSIYGGLLMPMPSLFQVTPLGGFLLMGGWLLLMLSGIFSIKPPSQTACEC